MLISMRGVRANCYNFKTNLLIHTAYYYINSIVARVSFGSTFSRVDY